MIKRTLFFGNPSYLSTKNEQILISFPDKNQESITIPIEDVGVLLLENQQITITNGLLEKLMNNKVVVISCDKTHMPSGLMLPINGNTQQAARFAIQIKASVPLKKNLWQQTISAKIHNQGKLLESRNIPCTKMFGWAKDVTSGDAKNHEARAAVFYWKVIFGEEDFLRDPDGLSPNNLLNYGYAILRAIAARAIVSSGMLPTLGIFHKNKYNAFCLADDIMEPYRVYVDKIVCDIADSNEPIDILTIALKQQLLRIASIDVQIDGKTSPLMVAMSRTTHSLFECYEGSVRKILYPTFC